ncbi:MAG: sigma 54-interacting transcriptional regulator [Deltaproteobacteria bacterium]|nr:sigma 54-interacting transcriptional regulator [Deltaproteobacteria bacterium]
MDVLVLYYRGEPLREFPLSGRPLEVGRALACDIVVHDDLVADRQLVVRRRGAEVVAYDVSDGPNRAPQRVGPDCALALGRHHALGRGRRSDPRTKAMTPHTDMMALPMSPGGAVYLVLDDGSGRRLRLGEHPVHVGGDAEANDFALPDPTVSARHFRLDPDGRGFVLRDLGSRNGTWVEGMLVRAVRIEGGARIRAGRTNLRILRERAARTGDLVFASPVMKRVVAEARDYASVSWPALIVGPSGSGKEGIARTLHSAGARSAGPFVALNAGGVPRQLIESELFGHEQGAFTGADSVRAGLFEEARGGTLFLDEVAELPLDLQSRLLRVLENFEVRKVGADRARSVDVRIVSATHRDLRSMVAEGTFREDLYYRLARLMITVPGLSERPEDVPLLAAHFLDEIVPEVGTRHLSDEAIVRLLAHPWPGNARELRNVVTAAALAVPGEVIQRGDVEIALARLAVPGTELSGTASLAAVVERHGGNLAAAARSLGIPRSTLRGRLTH